MTVPLVKAQNGVGWRSAGINEKGMIRGKTMRNIFSGERGLIRRWEYEEGDAEGYKTKSHLPYVLS